MTVLTPPGYTQGGTYTAKLDRVYLATLGKIPNLAATYSARQGFFGGRVPVYANPSGMNITMGACGAVVANTFASASGDYLVANDASVQVTLAASSPTLNRYDIIGFQVKDNLFDSSGLNTAVPAVIQGSNSAGTPSDPTLPASFIPVLRAVVNATNTSPAALQSMIRKTSSDGGLLRVASVTERAEITAHDGMQIYREDRDWVEIHDGTAWRVQGTAVCSSVADRNSAITNPYSGQLAVTTDSDTLWQYDGATSAWACIAARGVVARGNRTTTSNASSADDDDVPVLRVSNVLLRAGRLYEIWTCPLGLDSSSNNDEIGARIRYTTNATDATDTSTILPGSNIQTRQTDTNVAEHKVIQAVLPGADVTASFLLVVRRIAGVGGAQIFVDATKGDAIDLVIEDIGSDPGDTGTDL